MNKFRVFDKKKKTMNYKGFLLDNEGNLYKINKHNGLLMKCNQEYFVVMHCIGREDISGKEIYEKDILEYETGCHFIVGFGKHDVFCPGDKRDTTNQGYIAIDYNGDTPNYNEIYPLSELEKLARVIGYYIDENNIYGVSRTYAGEDM